MQYTNDQNTREQVLSQVIDMKNKIDEEYGFVDETESNLVDKLQALKTQIDQEFGFTDDNSINDFLAQLKVLKDNIDQEFGFAESLTEVANNVSAIQDAVKQLLELDDETESDSYSQLNDSFNDGSTAQDPRIPDVHLPDLSNSPNEQTTNE